MKRLKEINSSVDADVLASFLDSVENPNEVGFFSSDGRHCIQVDDYVEGYLGSSKVAKEFVKEYLQKRSESRKRKDTDKDASFLYMSFDEIISGSLKRQQSGFWLGYDRSRQEEGKGLFLDI